jgi:hypothetical protein
MPKKVHRTRAPGSMPEADVYDSLKPVVGELRDTVNQLNRASADFLKTDVETALVFSSIAMQAEDPSKRQRNRQNARKGYNTIVRLIGRIRLTDEDEQFLSEKLGRLKLELLRLGEVF